MNLARISLALPAPLRRAVVALLVLLALFISLVLPLLPGATSSSGVAKVYAACQDGVPWPHPNPDCVPTPTPVDH